MIKLINFFLEVECWCRYQPRKFWRHWKLFFAIFAVWCIAKAGLDSLSQLLPIPHIALIDVGMYFAIGVIGAWFYRRSQIGMERDLDFYIED